MPISISRLLLISLLLSAWMLVGGAGKLCAQKHTVTHFDYTPCAAGEQPVVKVSLNGKQVANFLLDTGCSFNSIADTLAQKLNLQVEPALTPDGLPMRLNDTDMQAVNITHLTQRSQAIGQVLKTPGNKVQASWGRDTWLDKLCSPAFASARRLFYPDGCFQHPVNSPIA